MKRFTPPSWLNALMRTMLRTPGLQRLVGRRTALVTFTGRRSGRTYTTPVSYTRRGDRVVLTAHRSRRWWRNLETEPRVRLRLAGRDVAGTAAIEQGHTALGYLVEFLEGQPMVARALGVDLVRGNADPMQAEALLADTVVVVVDVSPPPGDVEAGRRRATMPA